MADDAALFTRDGDRFLPDERTRGPWSDDAQHGGPVAALIAALVEAHVAERDHAVARISFELLRPIPLTPLRVSVSSDAGRSASRVRAAVTDRDGREIVTAAALCIRRKPVEIPAPAAEETPPRRPDDCPPVDLGPASDRVWFVTHAVDCRLAAGGGFFEPGPAAVWFRLRQPVVAGIPLSSLQRLCATADSGNGISGVAPFTELLYINPDLVVAAHREAEGEWILLDSTTRLHPDGRGLTESRLCDQRGTIGVALQSLLVAPRAERDAAS